MAGTLTIVAELPRTRSRARGVARVSVTVHVDDAPLRIVSGAQVTEERASERTLTLVDTLFPFRVAESDTDKSVGGATPDLAINVAVEARALIVTVEGIDTWE